MESSNFYGKPVMHILRIFSKGAWFYGLNFTFPISDSAGLRNVSHSIDFTDFSYGFRHNEPQDFQSLMGYGMDNTSCFVRGGSGVQSSLGIPGTFLVCLLTNNSNETMPRFELFW